MLIPLMILVAAPLFARDTCTVSRELRVSSPLGHELYVLVESPRTLAARLPSAVLIGGAGPDSHDAFTLRSDDGNNHAFRELSRLRVRAGFAVVRFDEMGVGLSTGDYAMNATTASLAADVAAIVVAVRRLDGLDPEAMMLIGFSEGASIALRVASADPLVAGVVSMGGPAWIGRRVVASQQALWLSRSGAPGSPSYERYRAELERENVVRVANDRWYQFFLDYDPTEPASRVSAPVLLLQARHDDYVLPSQAAELKAAIEHGGNSRVTLRYFEELEHTMARGASKLPPIAPEVVDTIISWSSREIGKGSAAQPRAFTPTPHACSSRTPRR